MSLPVVLLPEAQGELDDAVDWYEGQRTGLGTALLDAVQRVFDRISTTPEVHACVYQDVRRGVVRRFPYTVYYRVEASRVLVVAVHHSKRDPSVWQARV